jgi:hypothetical protein
MRGECENDGCHKLVKTNGYKRDGTRKYYKWCSQCHKKRYNDKWKKKYVPVPEEHRKKRESLKFGGYKKLDHCELCGFVALNKCQLDVDHIDGDHSNDSPDNLQTLCANCHRLKTWLNQDWKSNK